MSELLVSAIEVLGFAILVCVFLLSCSLKDSENKIERVFWKIIFLISTAILLCISLPDIFKGTADFLQEVVDLLRIFGG